MIEEKVELTIKPNTLMNRGPAIKRKRSKRGYDSLTEEERKILTEYKALITGKVKH